MEITSHAYRGEEDLIEMQAAVAKWTQVEDACVYLHVGDIPHRIYNGIRGRFPLAQMVRIWQIEGEIVGFVFCSPRHDGYDALIHPDHRGGEFERQLLNWGGQTTRKWMDEIEHQDSPMISDVFAGDEPRVLLLESFGYERGDHDLTLTERSLHDSIKDPRSDRGFHIRSVAGEHEAGALAEVHAGAFGSKWTPELYRDQVMTKPGYHVDREIVVVAPDGRFAAFCVCWFDELNGIGYFEPVGTHKDFRRQGLATDLMNYAMREMRERGLVRARVMYMVKNDASRRLYASLGFRDISQIYSFSLPA